MNYILDEENSISNEETLLQLGENFESIGRFEGITFINNTSFWEVGQVFYEGWDKDGNIPTGFRNRTGVTVGGVNVPPNRRSVSNVQSQIKVQANFVECGLTNLVHHRTGRRISQFKLRSKTAPSGRFYRRVKFGITDRRTLKNEDAFEVTATYLLNDGSIEVEYMGDQD